MDKLSDEFIRCMENQEQRRTELDIDNFNYDREYIRRFKFIMTNSCYLPIELIKHANNIINRKETINKLEELIKCFPVAVEIEKGIFEFTLVYSLMKNYIKTILPAIYNDKVNDLLRNLDPNNSVGNNKLRDSINNGEIELNKLMGSITKTMPNMPTNGDMPDITNIPGMEGIGDMMKNMMGSMGPMMGGSNKDKKSEEKIIIDENFLLFFFLEMSISKLLCAKHCKLKFTL